MTTRRQTLAVAVAVAVAVMAGLTAPTGAATAVTVPTAASNAAAGAAPEARIRQVLTAQFDRPDARLGVPVVVTVGAHAVASWTQGERGGRALLRQDSGQWRIVACGGEGMKDIRTLRDAGLSSAQAQAMSRDLKAAESRLPAADLARFASFEGLVRLDRAGQHPPHAGQPPAAGAAHTPAPAPAPAHTRQP